IDPAREDDERHPDRDDEEDRDAREQVLDVRAREEVRLRDREHDEDEEEQQEHDGEPARRGPGAAEPGADPGGQRLRPRVGAHACPPAKCAIRASVASSRESTAAILPRKSTAMRSHSVNSSGFSDDETSTAAPSSAASNSSR